MECRHHHLPRIKANTKAVSLSSKIQPFPYMLWLGLQYQISPAAGTAGKRNQCSAILWIRRRRLPHLESLVTVFLEIPYNSWKATGCLTHVSLRMEVFILGALAQRSYQNLVLFFYSYKLKALNFSWFCCSKNFFPNSQKLIMMAQAGATLMTRGMNPAERRNGICKEWEWWGEKPGSPGGGKKCHLQRGRGFQTLHGFGAWLPMWKMIPSVSLNLEENASDFSDCI